MLRRVSELKQFTLGATDGDLGIGSVRDVYFDDRTWTVRYIVVDTGNWLPGRHVLVSPISVCGLDPDRSSVRVALTTTQIKASPDVDGPFGGLIHRSQRDCRKPPSPCGRRCQTRSARAANAMPRHRLGGAPAPHRSRGDRGRRS
jgi:PRC-barrel domain protein